MKAVTSSVATVSLTGTLSESYATPILDRPAIFPTISGEVPGYSTFASFGPVWQDQSWDKEQKG